MLATAAATLAATSAQAAVTITTNAVQPAVGTFDQSQLLDDATIPGGTTPVGGGTYNSQAYTDNGGPPGQTFTTPGTKHLYALTGVSVKGVGDSGGDALTVGNTWGLRISEVSGTNLIPLKTTTGIANVAGATATDWVTLNITGSDVVALSPNKQYAFEVYTTNGWFGIDATQGDAAYAGGTAFNRRPGPHVHQQHARQSGEPRLRPHVHHALHDASGRPRRRGQQRHGERRGLQHHQGQSGEAGHDIHQRRPRRQQLRRPQ